jgi:hypothetical protein
VAVEDRDSPWKQGGLEIHDASAIPDIAPIAIVTARGIHMS